MRDLPTHHQHQEKSEQQKYQCGDTVLDADDLVVGSRRCILRQNPELLMVSFMDAVRDSVCGCLHDR